LTQSTPHSENPCNRTPDELALGDRLATVSELSSEDLALVTSFIDALVTKTRLKVLAGGS
jgi:hypothetical protein